MEVNENTARVRIYALGGLEIRAGWILRYRRRIRNLATRELLMGLIASGVRGLGASMLCEALWPEASGGEAFHALVATVHRLRRNLGCHAAIALEGGRVKLQAACCWIDAWIFEQRAVQARAAGDAVPAIELQRALEMYRGSLFGESASLLALDARERFGQLYARAALTAGERLLRGGDTAGAIALYERCVGIEDAREELYRALILAQRRLGQSAAAAQTYERCRASLQHRLGMAPSRATERARNESCPPQTGQGEGGDALAYSSTP
jgi:DNA-binding SARP family transcriptional activator